MTPEDSEVFRLERAPDQASGAENGSEWSRSGFPEPIPIESPRQKGPELGFLEDFRLHGARVLRNAPKCPEVLPDPLRFYLNRYAGSWIWSLRVEVFWIAPSNFEVLRSQIVENSRESGFQGLPLGPGSRNASS